MSDMTFLATEHVSQHATHRMSDMTFLATEHVSQHATHRICDTTRVVMCDLITIYQCNVYPYSTDEVKVTNG